MAEAFSPQCSFFHNNHIMETSWWVLICSSCFLEAALLNLFSLHTHTHTWRLVFSTNTTLKQCFQIHRVKAYSTWCHCSGSRILLLSALYMRRKLLKSLIISDAAHQHAMQQEDPSMGLYTCILPKEEHTQKRAHYYFVSFVPDICFTLGNLTYIQSWLDINLTFVYAFKIHVYMETYSVKCGLLTIYASLQYRFMYISGA